MKILHLLDEPWDSGITAYALQSAELLAADGHDVVVGVHSGKKPEGLAQKRKLITAPINSVSQLWALTRSKEWDVINVHNGRSHTWMVFFNMITGRRIPLVRTRGDARIVAVNVLSNFIYRRTTAVIAASEHIGQQYDQGFDFLRERIHTIYPSVAISTDVALPSSQHVGILGRLDPVKGHSVFLEAAALVLKECPEAKFDIAGKEAGISISLLQNQTDVLGISHAVRFLGFQESAEAFMKSCTLGVIASIGSEEISRACLEWFAVGRPVVGTLVGSIPELIEPDETGFLVAPNDSAAMAHAIVTLLRTPHQKETMGRKAHQQALSKYSAARQKVQLMAVYENSTH